jgi:uncharacterized membrane protein
MVPKTSSGMIVMDDDDDDDVAVAVVDGDDGVGVHDDGGFDAKVKKITAKAPNTAMMAGNKR